MTKEELARRKGNKSEVVRQTPAEALIANSMPSHKPAIKEEPVVIPTEVKKEGSAPAKSATIMPEKPEKKPVVKKEEKKEMLKAPTPAKNASKGKRGRKKGTQIVPEDMQKKNISISVAPEKEIKYKQIVNDNRMKYRSISQLVEQAMDFYIKAQGL